LDKVTVKYGYATFYITSVPTGKGKTADIPGGWGEGSRKGTAVLRNLDSPDLSFTDASAAGLNNHTGQYVAFDSIIGNRFTLRSEDKRPPVVFNEIVLRESNRRDFATTNFIYEDAGFDAADHTAITFANLLDLTKNGNVDGYYVSEVVIVGQNGTYLTVGTGSASKRMQATIAPIGLSEGQRVRVYYGAYYQSTPASTGGISYNRVQEGYSIYAIERL
jgi:hypothetical protein